MITGNMLRDMIMSAANNLGNKKTEINELNVFPVPDGDTGTNMSLTINTALPSIYGLVDQPVHLVADTFASSLLRSARGNSGVILSLLFRGFAKGAAGKNELGATDLSHCMKLGVESAYKAVMKPTEGTILTVARLASEVETSVNDTTAQALERMLDVAKDTLAKTPDMLPVLKQANVVDAGGYGYVVILEGALSCLRDGVVTAPYATEEPKTQAMANFEAFSFDDIKFAYCTEFLINKNNKVKEVDVDRYRNLLESLGDSIVMVDDEEIIKTHIHTNLPGRVLDRAVTLGMLSDMKIENMIEQHERLRKSSSAQRKSVPPEKRYGFVAVAGGEGICKVFSDLGADQLVEGGQTMNPSTEDILSAIDAVPAECVFVLPNNKNIIMAAEMAVKLSEKQVIVLPTKTLPQGISAMMLFDEGATPEDNKAAMMEALANVKTGHITYAVRDSVFDGKKIKEGEMLGLLESKLLCADKNPIKVAQKLLAGMVSSSSAFMTIFYGKDVTEEECGHLIDCVSAKLPNDVELTVVNGGQPVYHYIFSVE